MSIKLNGSNSGSVELDVLADAGLNTVITFPATSGEVIVSNTSGVINVQGDEVATNIISGDSIGKVQFNDGDGYTFADIEVQADANAGSGDYPSRLVFSTTADGNSTPTERMRITSGGDVLINRTTTNGSLCVDRSGTDVGNSVHVEVTGATISAGHTAYRVLSNGSGANGTNFRAFYVRTENGDRLYIYGNGNVVNANNSYGSLSDLKLKENIVDATSQWSDIKALQVRKYNFKEGQTHTQIGLIAQEVELISPGLVSTSPDRDEEGNDLGTVTKSVNYSVLYMKAVKALQEAMERIETLEASNAALDARLTALEGGAS